MFVHELNTPVLVAFMDVQNCSSPMSVEIAYEQIAPDTNPEIRAHVMIVPGKQVKEF